MPLSQRGEMCVSRQWLKLEGACRMLSWLPGPQAQASRRFSWAAAPWSGSRQVSPGAAVHSVLVYQVTNSSSVKCLAGLAPEHAATSHSLQASAVGGCWVVAVARCRATTTTAAYQAGHLQPAEAWQVQGQVVKIFTYQHSQASSRG